MPTDLDTARLLTPADLTYMGAFRFPRTLAGSEYGFTYLEGAMTYSPGWDTYDDGYPGALAVAGHAYERQVARVNIPPPRISRLYEELPSATLLHPFRPFGIMPPHSGVHVMALEELEGYMYVTMGDGYLPSNRPEQQRVMAWGPLDLSTHTPMRRISPRREDCFADYLFTIPRSWSDRYAPGRTLAIGRHREGNLCGAGPAIFAMSPLDDPETGDLSYTTLLMYREATRAEPDGSMARTSFGGDGVRAGAWVEWGGKSAVMLTGYKGLGNGTYGNRCNRQGFHDEVGYRPYFLFFDPEELGEVAAGRAPSHEPQPYAGLDVNARMMRPNVSACDRRHLDALAYDRARNLLYGTETGGERPVVHVWKVGR